MQTGLIIATPLACSVATMYIGLSKDRDPGRWAILGLLSSSIVVSLIVCARALLLREAP